VLQYTCDMLFDELELFLRAEAINQGENLSETRNWQTSALNHEATHLVTR
jgi:hypothetical protein